MMLILSIIFCVAGYLSGGYLLLSWLKLENRGVGESFLVGSGVVTLLTFALTLFFQGHLRLISLILLTTGILGFLCYLFSFIGQKANNLRNIFSNLLPILVMLVLVLPIMVGSYKVKVWGDEVGSWAPHVKEMLYYNHLLPPLETVERVFAWEYPPLWKIINVQAVVLFKSMHEGSGRIMSLLFILFGVLFVFEEFHKMWNVSVTKSTVWAALMLALVCGSEFPWTASWYSDLPFAIFLMAAAYHGIVGLTSDKKYIDFAKVGISSIFLAVCVSMRPDGIYFLLLFVLIAIYLMVFLKNETWQRKVFVLLLILLPSVILFFAWQKYVLSHGFAVFVSGSTQRAIIRNLFDVKELIKIISFTLKGFFEAKHSILSLLYIFFQYGSLLICVGILLILQGKLDKRESRILKLLLLFPIYNLCLVMGAVLSMVLYYNYSHVPMPTRYLLHTTPLVYFVLGVLLLRLYQVKKFPLRIERMISVVILLGVFLNSMAVGRLYSHLSHDVNDYMEHLSQVLKSNYSEVSKVQFIAQKSPQRIMRNFWNYYALPELRTIGPSSIGRSEGIDLSLVYRDTSLQTKRQYLHFLGDKKIQLVLVYESDPEFNRLNDLVLRGDKVYLLGFNEKRDGLTILWSEKRPPIDPLRRNWMRNSGKALLKEIMNLLIISNYE